MPENNTSQESFAALFNDKTVTSKNLSPGQKVTATVVGITQDAVFLDVGEKSEGFLDRKELENEDGEVAVKTGDTLEVYFLSAARNEMLFTTRIGSGSATHAHLEEAFRSSIPLEGFVKKEIKGGFEITVTGNVRAFCPYSQMELQRIADPAEYIDKHLLFKITQFEEGGRNIVLSRRTILEEEREQKMQELQEMLQEGMTVEGHITSIKEFGAFVDVGGIEGLIPISEIGWTRTENIADILSVGQEVEVVILKLDWKNKRFSFSLKQALPDPWENIAKQFPIGSFHTGKVVRLVKFGAFVTLARGIDGLIHISRLGGGRHINHPKEVIAEGQTVDVKIEDIDQAQKRIALSLAGEALDEETVETQEELRKHTREHNATEREGSMGTLGAILKARLKEKETK